jgi:uncharacterized protein (DUF433 family)
MDFQRAYLSPSETASVANITLKQVYRAGEEQLLPKEMTANQGVHVFGAALLDFYYQTEEELQASFRKQLIQSWYERFRATHSYMDWFFRPNLIGSEQKFDPTLRKNYAFGRNSIGGRGTIPSPRSEKLPLLDNKQLLLVDHTVRVDSIKASLNVGLYDHEKLYITTLNYDHAVSSIKDFLYVPLINFAVDSFNDIDLICSVDSKAVHIELKTFFANASSRISALQDAVAMADIDPKILSGTPVFKGTRIPIHDVAASVNASIDLERIQKSYPALTARQIELSTLYSKTYPLRGRPKRYVGVPAMAEPLTKKLVIGSPPGGAKK